MKIKLSYYLLDGAVWLFSLIPLPMLHGLSSALGWFVRDVIKYRHQVITGNLQKSFPNAGDDDIKRYRREFYRNFADILVETIKTRSTSVKFLQSHCKISNLTLLEEVGKKDIILVCGHRGNWEWIGVSFDNCVEHTTYTVYKPLSNVAIDKLIRNIRQRHGTVMVPMNKILREMMSPHDHPSVYVFLADQSPPRNDSRHIIQFLNQQTPVYLGPEKLAKATGFPVFYFDGIRIGRGRYMSHLQLISMDPKKEAEGFITKRFHELLEASIHQQPDNWLWSHRRWKYAAEPMSGNS